MMAKLVADKTTGLVKLVEERALSRKEEEKKKKQKENHVAYLPKDCVANILVRLPLESLQRSRFVCKLWYKMVNSSIFIDAHLCRSETVLIFLTKGPMTSIPQEKPNTFSVEANLFQPQFLPLFLMDPKSKYYIQFMEINDGKCKMGEFNATCLGNIRATCNGLILLDNKMKKGGVIVMNPVTRKLIALPVGTSFPPHNESYGLAFCNSTREYKLVHLFRDEMHYIGCEILILGTRSWRVVDGPYLGLFSWFGYNPVFAIGALHWVPDVDRSEYIVSMTMDNEKFHKIPLPKSSRSRDRIVEMGGLLCFVTHEETNQIDVWILRSLFGEDWIKQHTIKLGCLKNMVPLYCSRIMGEMIFKDKKGFLCAYDFQSQVMKTVEMEVGFPINGCHLPHVNSLVSWQIEQKGEDFGD
uniref:F-box domain-containing protein n=1 Tax=Davidia involucrata TaxID=16924 RepID=A0A5B6YQE0_DAVIN